jgi:hypothetical protein
MGLLAVKLNRRFHSDLPFLENRNGEAGKAATKTSGTSARFAAIERASKLVLNFALGRRDQATAQHGWISALPLRN